jgi:hypothetical protein
MQSENSEGGKKQESVQKTVKMTLNPDPVKSFNFDNVRLLSQDNIVPRSGNGTRTNPFVGTNKSGSRGTPSQKMKVKTENSTKQEKIFVPNFQTSHNGQIYLVTPDGRLRPTIMTIDGMHNLNVGDQSLTEKSSKTMPGKNIELYIC